MNKNDFKNLDALINETNKNSQVQIEAKDFLEENLLVIADLYLQAYQKKDYETLHKMLKEQRKLRKELTQKLRSCNDQTLIIACLQTYNIFNKLVQEAWRESTATQQPEN